MNTSRIPWGWVWIFVATASLVLGVATYDRWWPSAQRFISSTIANRKTKSSAEEHEGHDHGDDSHAHEGHEHAHDETNSLELTPQARGNIGLTAEFVRPLALQTFQRTITVPGIVTERPGRTLAEVSTPMAGVITHVHAVQGEAVEPGTLLFQIRITAEALVSTQTELLKTVGEIDVESREIARLTKATEGGAIPQKTLLERQYTKEKLEVMLGAHREALRLLGLSERQIDDITQQRKLLRELQIVAPLPDDHSHEELKLTDQAVRPVSFREPQSSAPEASASVAKTHPLILQEVKVHKGQTVAAGETLAVLADFADLFIEGQAFEQDLPLLSKAAKEGWKVTAVFEEAGNQVQSVPGLELVYSANAIHADSRTLPFFVRLPNEIEKQNGTTDKQRFVEWRYRLGQRLQLLVPVEEWPDRLVLPVDAVARDGADYFVFQQNGDHFDRVPVKVDYRDSRSVVIANDGSIFPGDIVALRGAHQMQMALKNKAGGGADPHAGHNH
ncbi:Biotin-requiring enzyme [Caulifigura coniformis]|uniref:Biotin-requiring enzyme n=1 Tax=Caulifigura coniformis TaxID=2527983 RepID=A0A517SLP7_9PLAN|nr:efflux RND transporter periplasmic adaptor subunit [Caulifigura coniformis]QDT57040.1 Biotin-requiring enzyme [Caulifigura coniformis]